MSLHAHIDTAARNAPARSVRSLAFEAFWRALPKDGLIPLRSAFRPERATPFLRDLLLLEASFGATTVLRIRLAGSGLEGRVHRSLTGENYTDYFSDAQRPHAIANAKAVVHRPCGRWTVSPVHYERGYAQYIEGTMFPLGAAGGSPPLILMLTNPLVSSILPMSTSGQAMHAHIPAVDGFIDIGAGVPEL